MSALDVFCAQLTRHLYAIAKFLFYTPNVSDVPVGVGNLEWWCYLIVIQELSCR